MTVETDVLALTAKITALNSRVTGRKDKLAAAVDTATDAVTLSATAEAGTLANRDELEDMRTLAYGYSTAAGTATPVADLTAIAQSKAVTAVDVFVYDTTKDSDGGAWRKRCQHTSWYRETLNTATRGSRREFPAVAVIVAEANKVTIYDGDDPTLPMWMVFTGQNMISGTTTYPHKAVYMLNGIMCVTSVTYGLATASFIEDTADRYWNASSRRVPAGGIERRNLSVADYTNFFDQNLVNSDINDVAMTVLPDAPIDPATCLPIPTIAVATDGGVSVITDSGAVYDGGTTFTFSAIGFDASNNLYSCRSVANFRVLAATPSDYTSGDNFGFYLLSNILATQYGGTNLRTLPEGFTWCFGGSNATGISIHLPDLSTSNANALRAQITSSYNTGWMLGDIKLATLSDTTPGTIAGQDELIVNGTFDTGVDGWIILQGTAQVVNGEVEITTGSVDRGRIYQVFDTEIGKTYEFSGTARNGTTGTFAHVSGVGVSYLNNVLYNVGSTSTTERYRFTATTNTVTVQLGGLSTEAGYTAYFDNISVKEVVADRSVNNSALQAYGNIVKSPVATGAELMAYSGFSTSLGNYLEQPYNSDLDFGTGDFCEMIWAYRTTASLRYFSSWGSDGSGDRRSIYVNSDNSVYWNLNEIGVGSVTLSGGTMKLNAWSHIVGVRKDGVAYIYVDGRLKASSAATLNLENTSAVQRVGISYAYTSALTDGKIALYKISATAPSAEQIKKIYEDEKVLFQEGAQATLYGSSNAVTALAYDDTTDLLHVGTSAGRSVFDGLRRIEHTTTAVGTAISASGGLVVEE